MQRGGLGLGDRRHPGQEVVDESELLGRVLRELGLGGVVGGGEESLQRGQLLGDHLDDDPTSIGRVGDTADIARLLESIDEPRDGPGREAHELGQPSGRGRAGVDEQLERTDIRVAQAEPDGHALAEDLALEVDPPECSDDGVEGGIAIHG